MKPTRYRNGLKKASALCVSLAIICAGNTKQIYPLMFLSAFADAKAGTSVLRPVIRDRNGEVLASNSVERSVFVDRKALVENQELIRTIRGVLKSVELNNISELSPAVEEVKIAQGISEEQADRIRHLNLQGVRVIEQTRRTYPYSNIASTIVGLLDSNERGITGIEKYIDGLKNKPNREIDGNITLSIDVATTRIVHDILMRDLNKFSANAGAVLILDIRSGEVIALLALPQVRPSDHPKNHDLGRNLITERVFEMGSIYKVLTVAQALDTGLVNIDTKIDVRDPLTFGKFQIHDYNPQNRILSIPEIITFSSNIGVARLVQELGVDRHQEFLRTVGQLSELRTELGEHAQPIVPEKWSELNSMTIAFGHGLAVTPLQAMMALSALVNGGFLIAPTFMKKTDTDDAKNKTRLVKAETSEAIKGILWKNAIEGTAQSMGTVQHEIGGLTMTSEKIVNGHYAPKRLMTASIAVLPISDPHYAILALLDEPNSSPATNGYATADYNSSKIIAEIIASTAVRLSGVKETIGQ